MINNGKVYGPIGWYEMASLLGTVQDEGNICLSTRINPFALFKPQAVMNETVKPITYAERETVNFGLTPYGFSASSYSSIVNWCNGDMNGWQYDRPKIGRIHDFSNPNGGYGYNHYAAKICSGITLVGGSGNSIQQNTPFSFIASFPVQNGNYDDTVTLDLIPAIKNCYFGIYLLRTAGGTSQARVLTADVPLNSRNSEGYDQVNLDPSSSADIPTGTWMAYPFLSTVKIQLGGQVTSGTIYTLPYSSPITFQVVSVGEVYQVKVVSVSKNALYNGATVVIAIINNSESSVTFNENSWQLRFAGKDQYEGLEMGEATGTFGNVTVGAGQTQNVTLNITGPNISFLDYSYVLWITIKNASLPAIITQHGI